MLRNYFRTFWRSFKRGGSYSAINAVGLAIALCVTLLLGLWVRDELSYNESFKNYRQLGKVMQNVKLSGGISTFSDMPIPLSAELRANFHDDFSHVAMASWNYAHVLAYRSRQMSAEGIFAQSELADMLSLKMIKGV